MKKLIALVLTLLFMFTLTGCQSDKTIGTPELNEITNYTQEQLEERLVGLLNEELYHSWGEPDGMLSGLYGDIWYISDEHDRQIVVYYDGDGVVEHILVDQQKQKMSFGFAPKLIDFRN